ncbi:MAG: selenium cofactor biosynthesis protein YqeC [Rudaea sp.]
MQLVQAFGIGDKEVVSLVGGGGKTTVMFRLAEELADEGKGVVTTTTTRIFAAQINLAPQHIVARDPEQAVRDVRAALREQKHVLVIGAGNPAEPEKAPGIAPELVDRIAGLDEVDVVIDEADGSRMRPLKAPGEHEPVIPSSTTLLVPLAGVDAAGAPLDDEHVHRASLAAALAGVPPGTTVDARIIAAILASPAGGLKNRPPNARVIPLINKAANVAQLLTGREIAWELLRSAPDMAAVAVGAAGNASMPVAELHRRVAAIVLAAGGSTRMQGELKQLLPWAGSTLVRHTVLVARQAEISEVLVVVGQRAAEVRAQVEGTGARVIENQAWAEGRSTSVRAGLDALVPEIAAAVFVNADQPFLTPAVVNALVQRYFHTLASVVAPRYEGQTGSPVLFDRSLFGELRTLTGESGGKRVLEARRDEAEFVNVVNTRAAMDIDTPEQYRAALAEAQANPLEGIMSTVSHGER